MNVISGRNGELSGRSAVQAQAGHHQGGCSIRWRDPGPRGVWYASCCAVSKLNDQRLFHTGDKEIRNTWVAADQVRTVREVWEQVAAEGYNVTFPTTPWSHLTQLTLEPTAQLSYHRVPVTRDQSPEDRYLDTYASILASIPTTSSLVFNCGIGVVRTTFAMCAALIVRRRQMMLQGMEDPYGIADDDVRVAMQQNARAAVVLKARSEQATRDQSLLRLMHVLQKSESEGMGARMEPVLIDDDRPRFSRTPFGPVPHELQAAAPREPPVCRAVVTSGHPQLTFLLPTQNRTALLGQYDIVLSLLSTLDHGSDHKKLVDCIVDHCPFLRALSGSRIPDLD